MKNEQIEKLRRDIEGEIKAGEDLIDKNQVEYHRNPTHSDIKFGYGCLHYCVFSLLECCIKGTKIPKKWLKDENGVRWYR